MRETASCQSSPEVPRLSDIWRNAYCRKLFLTLLAMAVMIATSSPQTPDMATAYLAQRGYTGITLRAPAPYHGRGQKHFPFEARSKAGERVSGDLSMGSFSWLYTIRLNDAPPQ
jgi:hypothetical protein